MKEFVKDYVGLCKESNKFMKKHWKGYTLLCVLVTGGELLYLNRWFIKESIEHRKSQKKEAQQ